MTYAEGTRRELLVVKEESSWPLERPVNKINRAYFTPSLSVTEQASLLSGCFINPEIRKNKGNDRGQAGH